MPVVKVPADVELEDKLAFGLTARQLALLAGTGVCAYGVYLLLSPLLGPVAGLAAALVLLVAGLLLALGRRDGMSGDQLALAAVRYLRLPKQHLLAPDGITAPLPGAPRMPRRVPLEIPVRRVFRSGLVERGDGGYCLLVDAHGSTFELRSAAEQEAFVDCFARFLNSRAEPVQLLVRGEPVTLDPHAERLDRGALTLPPPLAEAACEHAAFLRELANSARLRRRRIVIVFASRQRDPALAQASLDRQAAEAAQMLAGAELSLRPLAGEHAAALLAASLDPPGPPGGSHLEGVTHAATPASAHSHS